MHSLADTTLTDSGHALCATVASRALALAAKALPNIIALQPALFCLGTNGNAAALELLELAQLSCTERFAGYSLRLLPTLSEEDDSSTENECSIESLRLERPLSPYAHAHLTWAPSKPPSSIAGIHTGNNPASAAALRSANSFTLLCQTVGCGALVNYVSAKRSKSSQKRRHCLVGDGCGSRSCSSNHRPAQFKESQLQMALGLQRGTRTLVPWDQPPPPTGCTAGIWKVDPVTTQHVANHTLGSLRTKPQSLEPRPFSAAQNP